MSVVPNKSPKIGRRVIRIAAIVAGLSGGWIAAGVLNDHRSDIPRPVPLNITTMPTALPAH
jgi:hypothetical protein